MGMAITNISPGHSGMMSFVTQSPKKLLFLLLYRRQCILSAQDSKNLLILLQLFGQSLSILTFQKYVIRKHGLLLHMPASFIFPHSIISEAECIFQRLIRQMLPAGSYNILFFMIRTIKYVPDNKAPFLL